MEINGIMEANERTPTGVFELKFCPATRLLPDTPVESAGIYRCENCGYEAVVRKFECLPRERSCSEHGMAEPCENSAEVSWFLATPVQAKLPRPSRNRDRYRGQNREF